MTSIISLWDNTITFLGSGLGIFILVLLAIILVQFLIIWLLVWIVKRTTSKEKGIATQPAGATK